MITKKVPKIFYCESCDYKTSRKSQYDRHLLTLKHKMELNDNSKSSKMESIFKCNCGRVYKFASGLSRHKMTCQNQNMILSSKEDKKEDTELDYKSMFLTLVKQNADLQQTIQEIVPKIGNTTNNNTINQKIDIQLFLQDNCKNALNIHEFINSLQITIDDLKQTTNTGLIEGVTNTMIKGLSKLELHQRPIHCSDPKRDIMYIKDENVWDKDSNNEKLKKTIEEVADKQLQSFSTWEQAHPDYLLTEDGKNKYMKFLGNASVDLHEDKKKMNKIIKNIGKEVYLNKDDLNQN
jgi:hypothetical protein